MRTGLLRILLFTMTVALLMGAGTGAVFAADQSVELSPTMAYQPAGSSFALSAFYDVSDGNNGVGGLGVRFHFDSTKLQFAGFQSVFPTGLISTVDQPMNDPLDLDDEEKTDKYVSINWFSVSQDWPGPDATLPLELAKLDFQVDLSAAAGDTPINLSFFGGAGGHTTTSTNSLITITTDYSIGEEIELQVNPSRISSLEPSESILTATILDGEGYVVDSGPDSTLEITFAVVDTTYGHIKDGETNPVMATNGVATIVIESKVDAVGGDIFCTADATGSQGDLAQGVVTVTTSPFNIMPQGPVALLVKGTQEFYVTAGSPPYTWTVDGGGKLDKSVTQDPSEKVVFTAPGSETMDITVMVTDDTGLDSEAAINVYEPVEIPDKPDDPPTLRVGDSSPTLMVEGGDGTYTWTAKDSDDAILDMQEGESYGAFAGPHTIGATDSNGFEDTFDVHVPMEFAPQSMNLLAGEAFDLVLAGVASSVTAPAQISSVEFLDEDLNVIPEEEMDGYATFSPLPPIPFLGSSEATVTLTGASVTQTKMFQLRATVSGDPDLTESNGLNVATTGWIRVLPTATYSGRVKRMDPVLPIHGATVLFKLGGMPQGDPISTSIDGSFSAELSSPAVTGSEYDVEVLADSYLPRTDLTTADWDMENGETITLVERDPDSSVIGTVRSTLSSPIQGALVESEVKDKVVLAYADANGDYTLNLPEIDASDDPNGTWNFETTNSVTSEGCEPADEETGTLRLTQIGPNVTIVALDDDGPPFTGTVTDGEYTVSRTYDDDGGTSEETVTFTLSSSTEGSGEVAWSWIDEDESCAGTIDLRLWRENGEAITELFARASAPGFDALTQDILIDPDFLLNPLGSGDEVGPEGGILTSGDCVMNIPAGALDGPAQIELDCDIPVGPESVYTEHSVTLVEINIMGANVNEDTPIQVTIPFDTANVNPGDFQAGTARINYADSADDLTNGKNVKSVPPDDVAFEDHLNGLASFWLRHASVFGVGSRKKGKSSSSSSDCFIQTAGSSLQESASRRIPLALNVLLGIMMLGLVTGAYVLLLRRR